MTSTTSRIRRLGALLVAASALTLGVAVPAASAAPPPPKAQRIEMQRILDALRKDNTSPGAAITFGDGTSDVTLSSGRRAVLSRQPIRSDSRVRVGSDTKMFVSAVALQLVDEGLLALDAPIDAVLPGVLRYPADKVPGDVALYDGRTVTLRQLLQHTAGVPDYADLPYVLSPQHQVVSPTPQDLLAHALPQGPGFVPGSGWRYSNTDYTLVGLAIEAVTARSLKAEIDERIVRPLGLRNTFYADRYERAIGRDAVRGYVSSRVPLDVTNFEPGVWGAAGALVSSADDMNAFTSALLAGAVLSPARLADMQTTVPYLTGGYGLGIVALPLSCGMAWGHGGFVAGYNTLGLALPDGRHAFYTLNMSFATRLVPPAAPASATELFELALCSGSPG